MAKRAHYVCQACGNEYSKWMGRCPSCAEWNTLVEEKVITRSPSRRTWSVGPANDLKAESIVDIDSGDEKRFSSGFKELDRVLGGGIVIGSLGLVGGEPGIGKSTLMMQVACQVARSRGRVLYVSGEESLSQLRLRAKRIGALQPDIQVVAATNVDMIAAYVEELQPELVLIDSIQTAYAEELSSPPGSVSQVRECTGRFLRLAKEKEVAVILIGHVTKNGVIAGPKVLEHAVDYVLYFEGENYTTFRILRGVKNRYGPANEVGIFDMLESGLAEVANPSGLLIDQRPVGSSGSVVVPCMEGTRPLLVEIQALTAATPFGGTPRRQVTGVDYQRCSIILAVLEKRQKYPLQNQDVFINVAGGFRLQEPAVDLGIAVAAASSIRNQPVDPACAVIGEIGLSGEIRAVNHLDKRLRELEKMGFERCIIPQANLRGDEPLRVIGAATVQEALRELFTEGKGRR